MNKISSLLQKTSRTFAISIPLLPEPTREEVGLAYLVFRIIDTFEDGSLWPPAQRIAALDEVRQILQADDRVAGAELARRCQQNPPVARAEYVELLSELPLVMAGCAQMRPAAAAIIRRHAGITAAGMTGFVHRTDDSGTLQLQTMQDLRDYCYVVAGVVGDMLTELFLLDRPELYPLGSYLRARARLFGEALQVVNILKDASDDGQEGRIYLPAQVARQDVFALAREDLHKATEYTRALHEGGAPGGVVGFNLLLIRLASRTLDVVWQRGAGAKLTRAEVLATVADVVRALNEGLPLTGLEQGTAPQPA